MNQFLKQFEQMKGMMKTMDGNEGFGGVMDIAKKLSNSVTSKQ